MFSQICKASALATAAVFSTFALAMEPLKAIDLDDEEYDYYSSVIAIDQELVNKGMIGVYADYNVFNVNGRVVPINDGSVANPLNLVLTVNGSLYYVDAILNTVTTYKLRRRWVNNPEPGVFLRIEGTRVNPEDFKSEPVTLWIKMATPEGRALPVLKVLEGNYDL